jgi:hypothetical protein
MDTPESYGFKGPFKKLLKENPLFFDLLELVRNYLMKLTVKVGICWLFIG